jgi:hypothetical protein
MTYQPLTLDDGSSYFTNIGLIGSATSMVPILSHPTVLNAPSGYRSGTTITTTDSVVSQYGTSDDWMNWNFLDSGATSYSKILAIGYGIGDYFGITVSENEYTGTPAGAYFQDCYHWRSFDGKLQSNNGISWVNFATDATITLNDNTVQNQIIGLGLYLETDQVQKTFMKSGGQWFQVLSTTDNATGAAGFKTVGFYDSATTKRVVTPLMAWGVV